MGGGVVGGVAGGYLAREHNAIQKAYEMLVLDMLADRLEAEAPRMAARGLRVIGIHANPPTDCQRACAFNHLPGPHIMLGRAEVLPEPPLGGGEVAIAVAAAEPPAHVPSPPDSDIARQGLLQASL